MEFADFAVEMEEVLATTTTEYECTMLDENEIALGWQFLYEDSLDGFIVCEKEDEVFGFATVTIALRVANITGAPEVLLKALFELNMAFINVNLALLQMPEMEDNDASDDEMDNEDEQEPDEAPIQDILVMRTKVPYEQFAPTDFADHLQTLAAQAELVFDILEEPIEEE